MICKNLEAIDALALTMVPRLLNSSPTLRDLDRNISPLDSPSVQGLGTGLRLGRTNTSPSTSLPQITLTPCHICSSIGKIRMNGEWTPREGKRKMRGISHYSSFIVTVVLKSTTKKDEIFFSFFIKKHKRWYRLLIIAQIEIFYC